MGLPWGHFGASCYSRSACSCILLEAALLLVVGPTGSREDVGSGSRLLIAGPGRRLYLFSSRISLKDLHTRPAC
jgi:hypothetical protein